VAVCGHQELSDGALVRIGLGQGESHDDPMWAHREGHLEAVDPLGLGDTSAKGGLASREAVATGAGPYDGRYEGSVQHVVDL
jgi:hypothetical protein